MNASSLYLLLNCVTAIGCAMVAGAFYAFSSFIMGALGKIPPAQGIAAMQSINIVVINFSFMGLLFGTAALCLGAGVWSIVGWQRPGSAFVLAGALIYLLGTIGTTVVFNVPRNDALAVVDPASAEGAKVWATYLSQWTAWNTVRTIAALVAAALFVAAIVRTGD